MRQKINDKYKSAAEEFARRVTAALGEGVDSIVLFGSVARGEAKRDSDVDVLVVSPDPRAVRSAVSEICGDFTYERDYTFLISLVHFSGEELHHLRQLGSPFIGEVIAQGVVLYDNGTFARVCREAVSASR
ncbi:MAG: nucleotidyltransferase domain-containing protein [Dehalococcoidia bacterium]